MHRCAASALTRPRRPTPSILRPRARLLLLALPTLTPPLLAQGLTRAEIAAVDSVFQEWSDPAAPGAAVAITRDGQLIYSQGYGSAQLEYRIPVTPGTIFHVASVSKQFTTYAIALLARRHSRLRRRPAPPPPRAPRPGAPLHPPPTREPHLRRPRPVAAHGHGRVADGRRHHPRAGPPHDDAPARAQLRAGHRPPLLEYGFLPLGRGRRTGLGPGVRRLPRGARLPPTRYAPHACALRSHPDRAGTGVLVRAAQGRRVAEGRTQLREPGRDEPLHHSRGPRALDRRVRGPRRRR